MRDKYPLQITQAEVMEAVVDLNFEFFANLIRYPQPIDDLAREAAADFVLAVLTGKWGSKRQRAKMSATSRLSKMGNRVSELKEQNGLESAIAQAATEFKVTPRRAWDAWAIHQENARFVIGIVAKVAELQARGVSEEEGIRAVAVMTDAAIKRVNSRLKRKR